MRKNPSARWSRRLAPLALILGGSLAVAAEIREGIPNEFPRKKLIAAGWDTPTPAVLLDHLREIEQTPFDGIRIAIQGTDDAGAKFDASRLFTPAPWKREWFQNEIALLRKAKSAKLTDNFLSAGPGSKVDWFDDAGWKEVVEHFRIAAWIARESGLKGILFNPEMGTALPAFSYNRQPSRREHSFAEYAAKVRQRGREAMEAMAGEYPEMTLFCMFLDGGHGYSPFLQQGGLGAKETNFYVDGEAVKPAGPKGPLDVEEQSAPLERIEGGSYNLVPAFLNGWLDAIPPQMTVVDGLEQTYTGTERIGFITWAHRVHNTALPLVAPENRRKYRGQVEAGFGIYLDAYVNPPGSKYYVGPAPATDGATGTIRAEQVKMLGSAVRNALETSDGYVWLWGEKHRWWPVEGKQARRLKPETWEEIAPGISDALRSALDPSAQVKRTLLEASQRFAQMGDGGKNLVQDGGFSNPAGNAWAAQRDDANSGTMERDPKVGRREGGSARLSGGVAGCYLQGVRVRKGKGLYGIRAWVRKTGEGMASIRVRWKKGNGGYLLAESDNIHLSPNASAKEGDWMPVQGVVAVPAAKDTLVLQLTATGQKSNEDAAWFDDIQVCEID